MDGLGHDWLLGGGKSERTALGVYFVEKMPSTLTPSAAVILIYQHN